MPNTEAPVVSIPFNTSSPLSPFLSPLFPLSSPPLPADLFLVDFLSVSVKVGLTAQWTNLQVYRHLPYRAEKKSDVSSGRIHNGEMITKTYTVRRILLSHSGAIPKEAAG